MADSQALLEAMVDLGGQRERMQLMSWGVDLDHFRPSERKREDVRAGLGLPEGRVVLSPRTLWPLYNPRTIVDAFELLADELPDLQLVLKHMGTDRPPVGPLRHPDRVHIVGHVPYKQMVDWYHASDVCVSIASSDSSPRSVWEAVASGTPCVVSDLPWVHELMVAGRDALVVPIAVQPVAAAIRRIVEDPALADHLAGNGRRLVAAHHDQAVEMDRVADSYRKLAAVTI
jgi:glycosyltransferase involved in cell wall biosynthesis